MASTIVMGTGDNLGFILSRMEPKEVIKLARERKGWSQERLAKEVRISQPAIKKIEDGATIQSKYLPQIATALDLDLNDIMPQGRPEAAALIPRKELTTGVSDFPVHAAAEGGDGSLIVSSDPVDFIARPAPLVHVRSSYGILIVGTSMEPEFRQGDTALVHPGLPVMTDEPHIFYAESDGEGRATIKTLRRQTADNWLVSQHNPPEGGKKDFALSRREWQWAHRVVGSYKRR
ncbi:MAG: S24 family peptidase [Pseudolabrys sp.]|nr:S24 family peptidase [Pseudolabrys sp.]